MASIDIAFSDLRFSGRSRLLNDLSSFAAYFQTAKKSPSQRIGIKRDVYLDIITAAKKAELIEEGNPDSLTVTYHSTPLYPV